MNRQSIVQDYTNVSKSENLKVYVRLRPTEDGNTPSSTYFAGGKNGILTMTVN